MNTQNSTNVAHTLSQYEISESIQNFLKNWIFAALLIICVLALLLNSTVVIILAIHKSSRPQGTIYIGNLLIADLFYAIFSVPCQFHFNRIIGEKFSFHDFQSCKVSVFFYLFAIFASLLNTLMVTLDRYIAVTKPFRYKEILSPIRSFFSLSLIWSLSLVAAIIGTWTCNLSYSPRNPMQSCLIHHVLNRQTILVICVVMLTVFAALIIVYTIIVTEVRNNLKRTEPIGKGSFDKCVVLPDIKRRISIESNAIRSFETRGLKSETERQLTKDTKPKNKSHSKRSVNPPQYYRSKSGYLDDAFSKPPRRNSVKSPHKPNVDESCFLPTSCKDSKIRNIEDLFCVQARPKSPITKQDTGKNEDKEARPPIRIPANKVCASSTNQVIEHPSSLGNIQTSRKFSRSTSVEFNEWCGRFNQADRYCCCGISEEASDCSKDSNTSISAANTSTKISSRRLLQERDNTSSFDWIYWADQTGRRQKTEILALHYQRDDSMETSSKKKTGRLTCFETEVQEGEGMPRTGIDKGMNAKAVTPNAGELKIGMDKSMNIETATRNAGKWNKDIDKGMNAKAATPNAGELKIGIDKSMNIETATRNAGKWNKDIDKGMNAKAATPNAGELEIGMDKSMNIETATRNAGKWNKDIDKGMNAKAATPNAGKRKTGIAKGMNTETLTPNAGRRKTGITTSPKAGIKNRIDKESAIITCCINPETGINPSSNQEADMTGTNPDNSHPVKKRDAYTSKSDFIRSSPGKLHQRARSSSCFEFSLRNAFSLTDQDVNKPTLNASYSPGRSRLGSKHSYLDQSVVALLRNEEVTELLPHIMQCRKRNNMRRKSVNNLVRSVNLGPRSSASFKHSSPNRPRAYSWNGSGLEYQAVSSLVRNSKRSVIWIKDDEDCNQSSSGSTTYEDTKESLPCSNGMHSNTDGRGCSHFSQYNEQDFVMAVQNLAENSIPTVTSAKDMEKNSAPGRNRAENKKKFLPKNGKKIESKLMKKILKSSSGDRDVCDPRYPSVAASASQRRYFYIQAKEEIFSCSRRNSWANLYFSKKNVPLDGVLHATKSICEEGPDSKEDLESAASTTERYCDKNASNMAAPLRLSLPDLSVYCSCSKLMPDAKRTKDTQLIMTPTVADNDRPPLDAQAIGFECQVEEHLNINGHLRGSEDVIIKKQKTNDHVFQYPDGQLKPAIIFDKNRNLKDCISGKCLTPDMHRDLLRAASPEVRITMVLSKKKKADNKAFHAMCNVIGLYFVCWMPLLLALMLQLTHSHCSEYFMQVSNVLAAMNTVFNPILYVTRTQGFRLVFCRVISRLSR